MTTRISHKIIAAVVGVTLAIIGVFAYLMLTAQRSQQLKELERSAQQLSETVKSSTKYDMLLNQRESVHRIINTIGAQPGIEKVRIFNKEGAIIFSTDTLDVGKWVDKKAEACYACHAADQPLERVPIAERTRVFQTAAHPATLGIINPIYNEPSCWQAECHAHSAQQKVLGVLDITMSLAEVEAGMRASTMQLVLLAVSAIVAISLMIYLLVKIIVLQPLRQVVDATQHVAAGDLNYAIQLPQRDELGVMARSFNEMTRKLAETQRQLFQSEKLASVGRLAAGVAHEINNPLTGVLTYSSFLLKRVEDKPEMKDDLEVIVRETKRCREIVKGLLDFARQSPLEKNRVRLNEVIERSVQILANQLAKRKVQIIRQLAADLPEIEADANQLQQVLVNLIMNAGDAMHENGGVITIASALVRDEAEANARFIRLQVRDTGCGIPPENLSKIFEPFFSTKGQKGNGLGLAIVWGIIEKHNGRIAVESTVGEGTVFTILLPLKSETRVVER